MWPLFLIGCTVSASLGFILAGVLSSTKCSECVYMPRDSDAEVDKTHDWEALKDIERGQWAI
jgi:hypothetical protein